MEQFFLKQTAGLPNWAWGLVVVAGLGIGYYIMRSQSASATTPQTDAAGQAVATAPVDANALTATGTGPDQPQIVVLPLSSVAPGGSTSSDGSTGTSTDTTSSLTPPSSPGQPRGRTVSQTMITIRNRYSSSDPTVQKYDQLTASGVPVRAVPGGLMVRTQAYGSTVEATGPAIAGTANFGTNQWYPVQGGFISGFDVSGVAQSQSTVVVS